jgi:hypothetical protein
MRFCTNCNAALEYGEDLFCTVCINDGRQLKNKVVKEWKLNIKEKLDIVKKTIDSVEEDVEKIQDESE